MNTIALARRLRPRTFQAVVGQEVTLKALSTALETGRLHHAYLFTGTRGVGKTTLARLLAKCLNCEQGLGKNPCGHCETCLAIEEGRHVDVLEVDAASRTKVEDTRELLDNVQYLPVRSRFKVYIIDEVHMLSTHSFNALLKTLEEPPSHVKFLLATTDPQKLPITILSRCLQFHLHRLSFHSIVNYLQDVLTNEKIPFEKEALEELARAAEGSMRDALSLLEQAILYGQGRVHAKEVCKMLGVTERNQLFLILDSLSHQDGKKMLQTVQILSDTASDFAHILNELLILLRHIAILQEVPEGLDETIPELPKLEALSKQLEPEMVQLYYQIGILGQKEMPYAPNPRIGFEMILLRMLAFQPLELHTPTIVPPILEEKPLEKQIERKTERKIEKQIDTKTATAMDWSVLIEKLNLTGMLKELAMHCSLESYSNELMHLVLEESQKPLWQKRHEDKLREALSKELGPNLKLKITVGSGSNQASVNSPARVKSLEQEANQSQAREWVDKDPQIKEIIQTFDAKVIEIATE